MSSQRNSVEFEVDFGGTLFSLGDKELKIESNTSEKPPFTIEEDDRQGNVKGHNIETRTTKDGKEILVVVVVGKDGKKKIIPMKQDPKDLNNKMQRKADSQINARSQQVEQPKQTKPNNGVEGR